MKIVIRKSTDTDTGISVVKDGDRVETFNIAGEKVHAIEPTYSREGILTFRWLADVLDEEIKEILGGHALDAFIESKCSMLLVDVSRLTLNWDGVNDWLRDVSVPSMVEAGMHHMAVFIDSTPLPNANKYSLERFENHNNNVSASFISEEDALSWLRSRA